LNINTISGLIKSKNSEDISIYPNPTSDIIYISDVEFEELRIQDIEGGIVRTMNGNAASINVEDLKSGIYILEVTTKNGSFKKNFVKP
jgi:hypothetical protein